MQGVRRTRRRQNPGRPHPDLAQRHMPAVRPLQAADPTQRLLLPGVPKMLNIASLIALWLAYIPAANIINRYREKRPTGLKLWLAYSYLAFFWVIDVAYNLTLGNILFWQWAPVPKDWWDRKETLTLTYRMKWILRNLDESAWRWKLAYFICRYLVEPWDWNHCGLKSMDSN